MSRKEYSGKARGNGNRGQSKQSGVFAVDAETCNDAITYLDKLTGVVNKYTEREEKSKQLSLVYDFEVGSVRIRSDRRKVVVTKTLKYSKTNREHNRQVIGELTKILTGAKENAV